MKTLAKVLTDKLEIKENDSEKAQRWKAFGTGALDGVIVVGTVCSVLGYVKVIKKIIK